jgi:hypothetical protein
MSFEPTKLPEGLEKFVSTFSRAMGPILLFAAVVALIALIF